MRRRRQPTAVGPEGSMDGMRGLCGVRCQRWHPPCRSAAARLKRQVRPHGSLSPDMQHQSHSSSWSSPDLQGDRLTFHCDLLPALWQMLPCAGTLLMALQAARASSRPKEGDMANGQSHGQFGTLSRRVLRWLSKNVCATLGPPSIILIRQRAPL